MSAGVVCFYIFRSKVRSPSSIRDFRVERRRPVEAVGTGVSNVGMTPPACGGEEDAVTVWPSYLPAVNSVLGSP